MVQVSPSLIHQLTGWLRHREAVGIGDADLLRRVAESRDEQSFAAILDRHGPHVWGVCRRIATDGHMAEDVFQATFLLLIRKAGSVRNPAALAAWLHGAAYRLAVQARRQARRRMELERRAASPAVAPADDLSSRELFAILDEELNRLPDVYRVPLILCYLDGLSQNEAARRLGLSEGSIKGRLERGRVKLMRRLQWRGVGARALLVAPLAVAAVPADVAAQALRLVQPEASVPPSVSALVAAASPAFTTRPGIAVAALIVTAMIGLGLGFALPVARTPDEPPLPPKPETPAKTELETFPAGAVVRLGTTRLRPGGSVEFMAFSPDGKRLVSWSENHYTSYDGFVWDVATGRELKHLSVPGIKAHSCTWLTDGRGIAVVGLHWLGESGFFLWDFTTEKAVPPPNGADKQIGIFGVPANAADDEADSCFAVLPGGKWVAIGRSGNTNRERAIELREFNPGRRTTGLTTIRKLGNHPDNCDEVRFTPDGRSLLSFSKIRNNNGKPPKPALVVIWDVASGKEQRRITIPVPIVQGYRPALAVSNDYLALGMEDEKGTLRLFDLKSGQERTIATGHGAIGNSGGYGVSAVAFSPDGKTLFTGGRDYLVRVWDLAGDKEKQKLAGHCSWVETLAVSPDGKTLASAGQDGIVCLWDTATGVDACPQPGHAGGLAGVTMSPDGKSAITTARDGTLRLWDLANARELRSFSAGRNVVGGELSPDGRSIVVGGHDQSLKMWDVSSGKETSVPVAGKARLTQFIDAHTLLTVDDGAVQLRDWPGLKARQNFVLPPPAKQPGTPYCQSAALSADGKMLVTVANRSWYREDRGMRFGYAADGVIDLWDAATGKRMHRLLESEGCPRAALFTADGEVIVQGGGHLLNPDGTLHADLKAELNLIDPLTSRLRRTFAAAPVKPGVQFRYLTALALSPDGRSLYVADSTGVVLVYEIATGRLRREISGHRALITGLTVSKDGRRLLTASLDATALVWDLSPAAVVAHPAPMPTPAELATRWTELSGADAAVAYRAMAVFAAAPAEASMFLASKMSPAAAGPDSATLDRLVADLGNEKFPVREKASADLDRLGEPAVRGLRDRLANAASAEARARIVRLLDKHDPPEVTPNRLQLHRALELLEVLGTPEAKTLLTKLAAGAPEARLTREAKMSLSRLESRQRVP